MRKIIALMICTLFLAGSSNAEMVITNSVDVEAEVGDFIQYEFVDDSFILGIANAIDEYVKNLVNQLKSSNIFNFLYNLDSTTLLLLLK